MHIGITKEIAERLSRMYKRNYVTIWNWIQKYHHKQISLKRKRVSEFIVDETLLKVGSEYIWLWVTIKSETRQILALSISKERNMLIAERFLSDIVKIHGKHPVSTDGGTWYPQACKFLNLNHHIILQWRKA
jgi:putative transposase